jgi:serine phosphatase RsbU (regulator of sigma subunit)
MMDKIKENLLQQTYDKFIDIALGDAATDKWKDIIDNKIMGYGTAVDEKLLSFQDTLELINNQRKQVKTFDDYNYEIKPVLKRIFNNENSALIVNEIDLITVIDGEKNILPVRLSTILEYTDSKWVILHWHGSVAEHVSGGEDPWHVNEWKRRNAELEKIVNEKTTDLLVKNRELEIEAALEKVRSRTMAMHKSDELSETSFVLFQQFVELGFVPNRFFIGTINEVETIFDVWITDWGGTISSQNFKVSTQEPLMYNKVYKAWKAHDKSISLDINGENLIKWNEYLESMGLSVENRKSVSQINNSFAFFSKGWIAITTPEVAATETVQLLERFASVFDGTYTRFIDLKKAEAQTREAQIEAALERVRATSMAMHKSEQLAETAKVLFEQFELLGKIPDRMSIGIINEESKKAELWLTDQSGNQLNNEFFFSIDEPTSIAKIYTAWKEGKDSIIIDLTGQNLKDWLKFVKEEVKLSIDESKIKGRRVHHAAFFAHGFLLFSMHEPVADEIMQLLVRFARVFGHTFTRFLDLQKAEAQARESQIQLALERVRARTMAMQKSEELAETATILFEQLNALGELPDRVGICIINEKQKVWEQWVTNQEGIFLGHRINVSIEEPTSMAKLYNAWKEKKDHLVIDLRGQELKNWIKYVREEMKIFVDDTNIKGRRIHNGVFFSNGMFLCTTHEPFSKEIIKLLIRFVKVFDQTYMRFLDLQKAEAQAREAQIELALERVRASAMAMHNSNDVGNATAVMFTELEKLGIETIRCGIDIFDKSKIFEVWASASSNEGKIIQIIGKLDSSIHPHLQRVQEAWERKDKFISSVLEGQELEDYYEKLSVASDYKVPIIKARSDKQFNYVFFFKEGGLFAYRFKEFTEEEIRILQRFASVFGLTFRRYLDLQKAEAQAREAQIEAGLERVRSRTMAMHKSEELSETAAHLFAQLNELGIKPYRCNIAIVDAKLNRCQLWSTTNEGDVISIGPFIPLTESHIFNNMYNGWKNHRDSLFIKIAGEDRLAWINYINKYVSFVEYKPENIDMEKILHEVAVFSCVFFKQGFFVIHTTEEISESDFKIIQRFAKVFEQTYTRFLDLKKAEEQAREAIKQASLDRVRGQIASMRSTEDLKHITPLIWSELTNLDVPFIRCGVFIVDEKQDMVQVYLTTPDGKPLGVLNLHTNANELTSNTVEYWRKKKVYKEHWNKEEFINWSKSMIELGQIQSQEEYQGDVKPPESLDLHFIPFEQGMLYVGNKEPLTPEKIDLVKSLAEAFSIAYARYEDFERLEVAKKEVESAFGELDILSKELKIKNKELEKENQRKELELEEARAFQLSMLPTSLPTVENLDLAVYTITATEVGGDYYDFSFKEDGSLNIALGDATGHGMRSGTMVSIMKSFFIAQSNNTSIEEFFISSNNSLKQMSLNRMMMAFGMINISANQVKFCSAGIPPFIIYHKNSVEELPLYGLPLGAMKNTDYHFLERRLNSGDIIFAMSDGLAELKNEK